MRRFPILALALLLAGCPAPTKAPVKEKVVTAPNQGTTVVATPPANVPTLNRDPNLPSLPSDASVLFPSKAPEPDPVSPALTVSIFAGSGFPGSADGQGKAASFNRPTSVAATADGVVVADHDNNMLRLVAADATVTTLAGATTPGQADGAGKDARFNGPLGLAAAPDGRVFVSDAGSKAIRQYQVGQVGTLATNVGSQPGGIAYDGKGGLFIADAVDNHVRRLDLATGKVTDLAGSPDFNVHDGKGPAASFNSPQGVACDDQGNAYVADAGNRRIRKVTPDGTVTSLQLGNVAGTRLFQPSGLAWLPGGTLVVSDVANGRVLAIGPATKDAAPATVRLAQGLNAPQGVALVADGTLYVADPGAMEIHKLAGGVPKL
jgi:sugar lactone lactonase YvrE